MRRALFLLTLLLGLAAAAPPKDYYPHALGMTWHYTSGEVQKFVEVREMAGAEVWMLEHRYADGARMVEALAFRDDGVWVLAVQSAGETLAYDPPLKLYPPPPLKKGLSWQQTTTLRGQTLELSAVVLGIQGVEVPAGRFNAFRIQTRLQAAGGAESVVDLYFVPGVGVVRYATADGGVIDLVEFSR